MIADLDAPPANCLPDPIQFQNQSTGGLTYFWDFGDNNTSMLENPVHTYASSGVYDVMLVASDPSTCNLSDTAFTQVVVLSNSTFDLDDEEICEGETVQIGILPVIDTNITYLWSPPDGLSSTIVSNPFATPTETTDYQLLISNGICTDTIYQTVLVGGPEAIITPDTTICPGTSLDLVADAGGTVDEFLVVQ